MRMAESVNKRLDSLDVLRGLDIFILVCFRPLLFWLLCRSCFGTGEVAEFFKTQLTHCEWEGFHFWDLIMPLFLFMSGASIPFSLRKYNTSLASYVRIFRRVFLLFVFGMVIQGGLLTFNPDRFKFYSNTLQSIAVGYLITTLVFLNFKAKGRVVWAVLIFVAAWALMSFGGDFTPDGNFAEKIDKLLMGHFRDGVYLKGGEWVASPNYHYTWIVSSLNFGITVMLGAFSGCIMQGADKIANAKRLAVFAAALVVGGLLLSLQTPIIKKIWSSSMTLYSGGICVAAMAVFYYLIDCCGRLGWLGWLKIYGMNSIFAYMVSSVVNFRSIPESLLYGFEGRLVFGGVNYYPFLIDFCQYAIIFAILLFMFRRKIYLKV